MEFKTKMREWQALLENYAAGGTPFQSWLPEDIQDVAWDIVLVNGPAGFSSNFPGRMETIFTAHQIAANQPGAEICIHDTDCTVENIYSAFFFGRENLSPKSTNYATTAWAQVPTNMLFDKT